MSNIPWSPPNPALSPEATGFLVVIPISIYNELTLPSFDLLTIVTHDLLTCCNNE